MNCPTIPPNSKHFEVKESGLIYFKSENEMGFGIRLTMEKIQPTDFWIPIVSAVARCAWLDEAVLISGKPTYFFYNKDDVESKDRDVRQALDNAEVWAKWGRGEKWE